MNSIDPESTLPFSDSLSAITAAVAVSALLVSGCAAYTNAMNAAMKSDSASCGTIRVTNGLSVPVCGATLYNSRYPERTDNDLEGDEVLTAGGESDVDVPCVGDVSEPEDQPDTWNMRVYGCRTSGGFQEPGARLTTLEEIRVESSFNKTPVTIH